MANTVTHRPEFAYITRLTKHGTKYAACGGIYNRVLIAERGSAGGVTFLGQSALLTSAPLDIVSNGAPSAYYVLTALGITTLSAASAPAITAESVFKTGGHPWLVYTAGGNLLAPLAGGGVRLQTTAGVVLQELTGVLSESTAAVLSGGVLYVFDGLRGKMAAVTVTATGLTYEGTFDAPNCREVVRATIDGTNLYCLNRHRVVRFSIAAPLVPVLTQDYGRTSLTYTDIVVIGSNKVWCGFATFTEAPVGDLFFGPTFGVWDATNSELNAMATLSSAWTVNTETPYFTSASGFSPADALTLLPSAPVITSSLTLTLVPTVAFTYTITATGVGPIQFSSSTLPSWATLNAASGVITGTPPDATTTSISVTASNVGGVDTETLVAPAYASLGAIRVNNRVEALHREGDLLYMGGTFTSVTDASGTLTRNRAACLNLTTGLFTAWNPDVGGTVRAFASDGSFLYVGGSFATTAVTSRASLFRCSFTTGVIDSWNPNPDGFVNVLRYIGTDLLVGGAFTSISSVSRRGIARYAAGTIDSFNLTVAPTNPEVLDIHDSGGNYFLVGTFFISNRFRGLMHVDKTTGASIADPAGGGVWTAMRAAAVGTDFIVLGGDTAGGVPTAFTAQTRTARTFKVGPGTVVDVSWALAATRGALSYGGNYPAIVKDLTTDDVFIGAQFHSAPSTAPIMRWNSSSGARVGTFAVSASGTGAPLAMLRYLNGLIVGGEFGDLMGDAARAYFGVINVDTNAVI